MSILWTHYRKLRPYENNWPASIVRIMVWLWTIPYGCVYPKAPFPSASVWGVVKPLGGVSGTWNFRGIIWALRFLSEMWARGLMFLLWQSRADMKGAMLSLCDCPLKHESEYVSLCLICLARIFYHRRWGWGPVTEEEPVSQPRLFCYSRSLVSWGSHIWGTGKAGNRTWARILPASASIATLSLSETVRTQWKYVCVS